jgi:hypothetical protein
LVVLLAARDGADRVRFARRPNDWGVAAGRPDGSWEDFAPVAREAAVGQTLRSLTRTGWTERLWGWLWAAPTRPAEFNLRLGGEAGLRCLVTECEGGIQLSLLPRGAAAALAGEVTDVYWRLRGHAGAGGAAEPGGAPDTGCHEG